jgi:hypothetical protein
LNKILEPISCDFLYGLKEEDDETQDKVENLPGANKDAAGEAKDDLAEITEVDENLEASVFNSKIEDLGSSMVGSKVEN